MAKASISLRSLKETLNRVETKLQTVEAQFGDLDSSLQELAQKFELLEKELGQDTSWTRALGERLGSEEERQPGRRERLVSEGRAGAARRPPLREPGAVPAAGAVRVPAAGPGSCSSSQTKEQGRTSSAAQESFISPSERGAESITEAAFEGHAYTEKLAEWKVKSELSDTELAEWKVKLRVTMSKKSEAPLSLSDCLCQICMEIFVEPVTLPCSHTLCNSCFQLTVEKASLCCPFCRRRVSSWARYNARRNTLVNWELWEKIQKDYPKECEQRINGQDLEEEICVPRPQHQLSKPGELRQEYEAEISKVEAERRAHEQEENKASEEYIQQLLAEEEEEHRLAEERRREMEKQLKQDEELAWQLSNSLNEDSKGHVLSSPSPSQTSPASLCKMKSRSSNSGDIQKYLSPKLHHTLGPASFSGRTERGRSDSGSVDIGSSEGNSSAWQDGQEEMPTLSPQLSGVTKDSSAKDSFLELCMNYFSASASEETAAVKQDKTPGLNGLGDELPDELHGITKGEGSRTALGRSKGEEDGIESDGGNLTRVESINCQNSAETRTCIESAPNSDSKSVICDLMSVAGHSGEEEPERLQDAKETPKRKSPEPAADVGVDLCVLDKRRRTFPESLEDQGWQINDFNLQMQKAFEQEFYERRMQEEQDRLLAVELQKQINKEERTLNRQKGSPDQYLLRTKSPQSVKDSPARKGSSKMAKDSKVPKKQAETNHRKTRKGSCNENWQSPTRVPVKSPSIKGGKVLNCVVNTSDANDICSLPKNKQKTIVQMFKSSVSE